MTIQVQVKLFASLRKNRIENVKLENGSDARNLIHQLGIPIEEVGVLSVNGQLATLRQRLEDGDVVNIAPFIGGG